MDMGIYIQACEIILSDLSFQYGGLTNRQCFVEDLDKSENAHYDMVFDENRVAIPPYIVSRLLILGYSLNPILLWYLPLENAETASSKLFRLCSQTEA